MPKLPQIAVGYIRGHQVAAGFMESLLGTVLYDAETWRVLQGRIVNCFCAHYLNVGRNALTRKMLAEVPAEVEVFVSLDTDHTFAPEQLMHLAALVDREERPVVGGLYWACDHGGAQVRPVLLRRDAQGRPHAVWDYPPDALVEVDVVGMGFTAVHRSVYERMAAECGPRWFDFDETSAGDFMPEDNAFCRRVQEWLGGKIHVHTGIAIGHVKTVELSRRDEKNAAYQPAGGEASTETKSNERKP